MSAQIELILGGVRSGKSRLAEQRAAKSGMKKVYVATATGKDEEMTARIREHQKRREQISKSEPWRVLEEPVHLARVLKSVHADDTCILVDCLTLWISNTLHKQCWETERDELLCVLPQLSGRIIFVSNEVGMGVVPLGQITRQFVDASGALHQELSESCHRVTLTIAGMAVELKPN